MAAFHGVGQPDLPGILEFEMTDVEATEVGGIAPSPIINISNDFTMDVELELNGLLAGLIVGEDYNLILHVERLEDGDRKNLNANDGGPFTVPSTGTFTATTRRFTTGDAGSPADFEIAPGGFVASTFEVTVHVHFVDPTKRRIVAAFSSFYLEVIK